MAIESPFSSAPVGDTWTWNGATWHLQTTIGPSRVRPSSLTWDSVRNVGVAVTDLHETWEWDGNAWARKADVPLNLQYGSAIAFDAARNKTVLVNGAPRFEQTTQILEWDGTAWAASVAASPPPRGDQTLTYDPLRHRIVMFGGEHNFNPNNNGFETVLNEVWEFDGATWTKMAPSGPLPPPAWLHGAAFDPVQGKVVIYGGFPPGTAQMWSWDGVQWTSGSVSAVEQLRPSLVADTASNQLISASTLRGMNDGVYGWQLQTKSSASPWTQVASSEGFFPIPYDQFISGFDEARGVLVVFGGVLPYGAATRDNSTWEFDGHAWTQRTFAVNPSPRSSATMVYDSVRRKIVMVGGTDGSNLFPETWEYDGISWTLMSTNPIAARRLERLAFDPVRGVVVMHGGYAGEFQHDTFEWDGTTWTQRVVSTTLPFDMGMAFDHNTQTMLGVGQGTRSFNGGSSWTSLLARPTVSGDPVVWDDALGSVLAWGSSGNNYDGSTARGMWRWRGGSWQPVPITGTRPQFDDQLSYDAHRDRLIVYRGPDDGLWQWFHPTADIGRAGGFTGPDGQLDNNDFIAFITNFFAQDPRADVGKAGGFGGSDQLFDNNDFIAFIDLFFNGCGL